MKRLVLGLLAIVAAAVAFVAWFGLRGEAVLDDAAVAATPAMVARGAYLARAGNCAACHTDRGGAPYAGGKGIATPFGTVFASNLTPDAGTGIGTWTPAQFWRALHDGRSADGRLLYPAFPYPSFTAVTREDSDALYAFLRTQPPAVHANRPHALRFPYDTQAALAAWRALFFRPGTFAPEPARTAQWNRGAYLVRGLGHCAACHSPRNVFGATRDSLELSGGLIPMQDWTAPSLAAATEAGVADWPAAEVVALLKTGLTPHGATLGPMAEVVFGSTQHLDDADLQAMAVYLRGLPQTPEQAAATADVGQATLARGGAIYEARCAGCHGRQGEGATSGQGVAVAALAGNRKVLLAAPGNLLHVVMDGGFPPATAGNPRPFGMPPFGVQLKDDELAAVATYVRNAWGNHASEVTAVDVLQAK